ncbi:phage head spike fiber domain-containing protein [Rahnella aceris]
MTTIVQSNMKLKGNVKLPSANAPLPDGANLFADFSTGRYVIKHASGNVIRSASLTDVLSFTRATIATRVGETGLIEYLQSGEPAIDYDPVTLECLGLRTELSSINRIAWSQDFTKTASWTPAGVSLTVNDAISPDGNATATKLAETADSTAAVRTLLAITTSNAVAASPYTFSIFAKANTAGVIQLAAQGAIAATAFANFDLRNGKIGKVSPGSATVGMFQVTMEPYRNGWYRIAITITPNASASPQFTVALVNDDSSAAALPSYLPGTPKSVWIWGAQPERRDGYSSYIPTAGAEVTRDSDVCTTPSTTAFITAAAGTILASVVNPHSLQTLSGLYNSLACVAVLDNNATGPHIRFAYRPPAPGTAMGTPQGAALGVVPDSSGTAQNLEIPSMTAVRDSEQSCIFAFDSTALTTKLFDGYNWYSRLVTAAPPALSRLCIGRSYMGGTNYFNGHIRKIIYWPTALSDDEMEKILSYQ